MGLKFFFISDVELDSGDASTTHSLELFKNLGKFNETYLFMRKSKSILKLDRVIYVPVPFSFLKAVIFQISLFFYLFYYSIKHSPTVFYMRYSLLGFSPFLISYFFRIPLVIEINGLSIDENEMSRKKPKFIVYLAKVSPKICYKHADKIVTVTKEIRDIIVKNYGLSNDDVVAISNGANIDFFHDNNKGESKKKLSLKNEALYVCFFGSLASWQGVEFLINSAPIVLEKFPLVKFLIVGDGPLRLELEVLVEKLKVTESFIFTGKVDYDLVPNYISACDICVIPKRPLKSGYSPLKLYESMACARPIVASRLSGFEVLEETNSGVLVTPEDYNDLARGINLLLADPSLRETMGRNGREYVVKNHSWESVARKVADVCESAIRK